MSGHPLRAAAAIAGVGEAGIGDAPEGATPLDLIGWATAAALEESGIAKSEIDALFTASAFYGMPGLNVAEYLGIRPRYSDATNMGGSSFVAHLQHAAAALHAGLCDVALVAYGSTQRSQGGKLRSVAEEFPYEERARPRYPITQYALAAARHMHEFGTTRAHLAEVAVAARRWAQRTPGAFRTEPLSVEEVLSARMVCDPLTVRDACLVTDGAGAVLVTRPERARAARTEPVLVLGAGEAHWHRHISQMPSLVETAATESGARAYAMAGLAAADVDVVQVYDAFTINTILFLEDLGFCAKGEGGPFVADGGIAPGGRLAVNTNGGGLSYCHPGMYGIFTVIESVRQLRGERGDAQVEGCEVALAHGNGAVLSSQATVLLGTEAAG